MIDKIKSYIKEYSLLIISGLILAFMLRGCNIDRAERRYEYAKNNYEYIIDSLHNQIKYNRDTLQALRAENEMLKYNIDNVRRDVEHYRNANRNLINVTKNLSTRDTIK